MRSLSVRVSQSQLIVKIGKVSPVPHHLSEKLTFVLKFLPYSERSGNRNALGRLGKAFGRRFGDGNGGTPGREEPVAKARLGSAGLVGQSW
jgi:hypothetical protein